MTTLNSSELLACFDDAGQPIAPKPRSVVHKKPHSIWHGVTGIWLLNDGFEILVTKRAQSNEGNPGKWQTYIGGHVRAGQSFRESALAELKEELGIKVGPSSLVLVSKQKRVDFMHLVHMFALKYRQPLAELTYSDGEIENARLLSLEEYDKLKMAQSEQWCNSISREQYEAARRSLQS